tara:strand:- start:818 stop:1552 length:735 start_codon:yes stop_codon:yes gene_type:complete
MSKLIDVAILVRNTIVREGLARILEDENFTILQSLEDPYGTDLNIDSNASSDFLIVIDNESECTDLSNVEELRERFPDARLVLLIDTFDFNGMLRAFRHGVDGYLVKQIGYEQLIGSLKLVAMGEKVIPSEFTENLPEEKISTKNSSGFGSVVAAKLSAREIQILQCLIMGYPNKVVSRQLKISEATVKVHVKAILRKLGVQNRTQAAIWAVNHGVEPELTSENAEMVNHIVAPADHVATHVAA